MQRIYLDHLRDPVCRALTLGASGFLVATSAALAAGAYDPAASQSRYQAERNGCLSGQSQQDQATCLREAAAAREAARRGQLDNGAADYQRNALARCQPLPADQRADCVDRMQGRGTTSGSVGEGGIYREKVTREIGVPPATGLPPATTLPPAGTVPPHANMPPETVPPAPATMPPARTTPAPLPAEPLPARPPAY
jgi:hypothetical protein